MHRKLVVARVGWLLAAGLSLGLAGCDQPKPKPRPTVPEDLKPYVLDAVPAEVKHRVSIDFENKLQLVAYDVTPTDKVRRGETIDVKLYWRAIAPPHAGGAGGEWQLVTHLLGQRGHVVPPEQVEIVGPLRGGALPLTAWQPGKIYVDEHRITVPADLASKTVTVTVGVERGWRYRRMRVDPVPSASAGAELEAAPEMPSEAETAAAASAAKHGVPGQITARLRVIGGPNDGHDRGVIVHLRTDYVPPPRPATSGRATPLDDAAPGDAAAAAPEPGAEPE